MASSIRKEKRSIAASRAMEEQHERHNPLSGAGATPSMGLSQFRGGMKSESDSDDESVGGMLRKRVGGKKSKSMDEATAMGLHLAKHLHGLHGNDFLQKFGAGMVGGAMMCEGKGMSGAGFFDDLKHAFSDEVWNPQKNGVAQAFSDFGKSVKQEFVDPSSTLRGTVLPGAAKALSALTAIPGVGQVLAPVTGLVDAAQAANMAAKSVGLGRRKGKGKLVITHGGNASKSGAYEGEGFWDDVKSMGKKVVSEIARDPQGALEKAKKGYEVGKQVYSAVKGGKKKRAPAGPSDGRRVRAEIVKKVMREKGMKMIEASRWVKQHGLY